MRADKLFYKQSLTRLPKLKFEADKKDDPLKMAESPEDMKPEKFKIRILDKFEGFRKLPSSTSDESRRRDFKVEVLVRRNLMNISGEKFEPIQRVDKKILFESTESSAKFSVSFADEDLSFQDL